MFGCDCGDYCVWCAPQLCGPPEPEPETWPCNDCGQPTLKGDELCGPCYEKEARERDNAEGDSFRALGLCEADFR